MVITRHSMVVGLDLGVEFNTVFDDDEHKADP